MEFYNVIYEIYNNNTKVGEQWREDLTNNPIEKEIIGILSREEIANIIDRKLNEIYEEEKQSKLNDSEVLNKEETERVIEEKMNEVVVDEKVTKEEITEEAEAAMEEEGYEEIFEGSFINNRQLTEEEAKAKVIELMERVGM